MRVTSYTPGLPHRHPHVWTDTAFGLHAACVMAERFPSETFYVNGAMYIVIYNNVLHAAVLTYVVDGLDK